MTTPSPRVLALLGATATALLAITPALAGETVDPSIGYSANAGAPSELRKELVEEPTLWEALRSQYRPPTTPPEHPDLGGLRNAPVPINLRNAVLTAVKYNPAVIAESLSPLAQETGILEAQAQFDPIFEAEAGFGREATPVSSILNGGSEGAFRNTTTNGIWNLSLSKQLRTGAGFSLNFDNSRLGNDASIPLGPDGQTIPFQLFNPEFRPQLTASLNQPLLRGFGLYFTSLRIRVAEAATDAAVESYRAAVANFIQGVVANYWAVVGLQERLEVLKASLELAEKTVRENRTRVDVGVLPPVAVLESQAEAARRKEEVIIASNELAQARLQLRQQVFLPSDDPFLPQAVEPTDRPASGKAEVTVEEALRIAMDQRPEIQAAKYQIKSRELLTTFEENGVLPRVDLFGRFGVNGLAGPNSTTPIERFEGNYADSLNWMVDGRFYSYQAGVRIEVPIGNAGAKARATRARVEEQQAFTRYRQTVSEVSLEVGRAVSDLRSDVERIETTRVTQELSAQNLRNQNKRYEVGMVTTTDLLGFQNDLAAAKVGHIQALIEYNISQAQLDRAQGTLLKRFNVEISTRDETETPWWATF